MYTRNLHTSNQRNNCIFNVRSENKEKATFLRQWDSLFEQNKGVLLSKFDNSKTNPKRRDLDGYNGGSKCSCQRRETNGGGNPVNPEGFPCLEKHAPSEQHVDFRAAAKAPCAPSWNNHATIIAGLTTVLRHPPIRRWFYARAASDVRNAQTGATGIKWTPDLTSDVGAKSRAYGFYATGPWSLPDESWMLPFWGLYLY